MSAPITLTGRLGQDPSLRFAPSGTAVASFSIVTSRRTKNDQNEWTDTDTTWWDCTAFRQLAENAVESLTKGMAVIAVGRIVQENWEDKEGQKRSKLAVKLDAIGPDLNRATARVEKTNSQSPNGDGRQGNQGGGWGGSSGGQAQGGDPWAANAPNDNRSGWGAPQQGGSEPPF